MSATQIGLGTLYDDESTPQNQHIYTASNGDKIAIFDLVRGTGGFSVSQDSGATWSVPVQLPGISGGDTNIASGVTFYDSTLDILYLFNQSSGNLTEPYNNIRAWIYTYNTGTHVLDTEAHQDFINFDGTESGVGSFGPFAVCTDGTFFHVAVFCTTYYGSQRIYLFSTKADGATENQQAILWTYSTVPSMDLQIDGSDKLYLTFADDRTGNVTFYPYTFTNAGGVQYTIPAVTSKELAYAYTVGSHPLQHATMVDPTGPYLDILVQQGANLYALRRTSTNVYSLIQPLYAGLATDKVFALTQNPTSGDLYLVFESDANPQGEIYGVKRLSVAGPSSGQWQAVEKVMGAPAMMPSPERQLRTTSIDLVFAQTDPSTGTTSIFYYSIPAASAPNPPVPSAPIGNIGTLVPQFSWISTNPSLNDPDQAYQIQAFLHGSGTPIWDSGSVSSANPTGTYGGPGLAYNTAYDWRVRVKDSVTASGAGTWSSYSSLATFTPKQRPSITITSLHSGTSSFSTGPAAIPSPTLSATVSYSQADLDAASLNRLLIYAADGVTLIDAQQLQTIGPPLTSGSSMTTNPFTSDKLINGLTYKIAIEMTDGTTLVAGQSALFTVTATFPAPPDVSSATAAAHPTLGYVSLAWINPIGTTGIIIDYVRHGRVKHSTLYNGVPLTSYNAYIPTRQAYDIRIRAIDPHGNPSPGVIVGGGSTVLPINGDYGVWVNVADDLGTNLCFGAPDDWSQTQLTKNQLEDDYVPMGRDKPIAFFSPAKWREQTTVKWWVAAEAFDFNGDPIYGQDLIEDFGDIVDMHTKLLYRDPIGRIFTCIICNLSDEVDEDIHFKIQFDIKEVGEVDV